MPEGVVYDVSDVLGLICLWNAEGQSGNAGATPMLEVGRDVFTDRTWQTPKGHCLNDVVWNAVMVARGPPPPTNPRLEPSVWPGKYTCLSTQTPPLTFLPQPLAPHTRWPTVGPGDVPGTTSQLGLGPLKPGSRRTDSWPLMACKNQLKLVRWTARAPSSCASLPAREKKEQDGEWGGGGGVGRGEGQIQGLGHLSYSSYYCCVTNDPQRSQ